MRNGESVIRNCLVCGEPVNIYRSMVDEKTMRYVIRHPASAPCKARMESAVFSADEPYKNRKRVKEKLITRWNTGL